MINTETHYRFAPDSGTEEHFFLIPAPAGGEDFGKILLDLKERYEQAVSAAGLPRESQIMCRLFLSDIANQYDLIAQSTLFPEISRGAFSLLEQRPCCSSHAVLLAYHLHHPGQLLEKIIRIDSDNCRNSVFLRGAHYNLLLQCHYNGSQPVSVEEQTREAFEHLDNDLKLHTMELAENTIRTWVFVRDIDNHYQGMGDERRRFFQRHNLTEHTRYIASTGIEARLMTPSTLVSIDALSLKNLQPGQMQRMEAPSHLCPTSTYGITFERGTKLTFGDREHLYLSGTASINPRGEIVAPRDIVGQTRRTLANIAALLEPHGATIADLTHAVVYLRNSLDAEQVTRILEQEIPAQVPVVLVHAPVCRPGWLVEIEGLAVRKATASFPPFI
jgi:enamine deaminase RidA (YjgF/YER057c/UK114 family)